MTTAERPESVAGVVCECELAEGVPAIAGTGHETEALVLVRLFSEPLGLLSQRLPPEGVDPRALAHTIARELEPQLRERFLECGLSWPHELPTGGLRPPRTPRFLSSRARALREGPEMTVAVCTRDRPEGIPALVRSLSAQRYQRLHILVVDNAPSDDRTKQVVSALSREHDIRYVTEPRPGLSWARNRAIEASDTEVVAWADDDEVCDQWWAAELARGYVEVPTADAVTGLVVPAELQTPSQALFEQYSGVGRSRGFTRAVFSPASAHDHSPLYPLPPFGVGGNMSFRRDALERIGRFDCALGPGTLSMDGDDTAAMSALLLAGGTIVYQPTAVVHHRHRRDYGVLEHLMQGYGRGLGAYYASMLARRPSCAVELLRLSRRAVREHFSSDGRRLTGLGDDFPRELLRANRVGLFQGPFVYARARIDARRLAASHASG